MNRRPDPGDARRPPSRITSSVALSEGTHVCLSGAFAVFLSLPLDRYLCVRASELDAASDALVRRGLLRASDDPGSPVIAANTMCPRAVSDLRLEQWAPTGRFLGRSVWRFIAPFVSAILAAERDVRSQSLERTISLIQCHQARKSPSTAEALRTPVEAFQSLRPLYWRPYRCLFDSLALLHFLHRLDLTAMWVFGVRSEPFEAHCWLQSGGVVLNDSVDRVAAHTPCAAF